MINNFYPLKTGVKFNTFFQHSLNTLTTLITFCSMVLKVLKSGSNYVKSRSFDSCFYNALTCFIFQFTWGWILQFSRDVPLWGLSSTTIPWQWPLGCWTRGRPRRAWPWPYATLHDSLSAASGKYILVIIVRCNMWHGDPSALLALWESISACGFPSQRASDAQLRCFFYC